MREFERKLIENNMCVVDYVVKDMIKKRYIPKEEYEDYRQMGFLILCSKVHKYDGRTKFKTFADKVLKNAFIDMHRTNHDIETLSLDAKLCDNDENDEELINLLAAPDNTENEAIAKVTADMMKEHFNRVKEKCTAKTTVRGFEALELKMQGYSGMEIAEMFNVPANSLRSWMSKAKKLLVNDAEVKACYTIINF